jgi:hypothetical protein
VGSSGYGVDPAWWPGGDRLSRSLSCSTMGAEVFHGRVRDGIGCINLAMTTGSPGRILVRTGDWVWQRVGRSRGERGERGLVLRAVSSELDVAAGGMGVLSGD